MRWEKNVSVQWFSDDAEDSLNQPLIIARLVSKPLSHRIFLTAASNLTAYIQSRYTTAFSYTLCMLLGHRLQREMPPLPQPTIAEGAGRRTVQLGERKGLAIASAPAGGAGGSKGTDGITRYYKQSHILTVKSY